MLIELDHPTAGGVSTYGGKSDAFPGDAPVLMN